MQNAGYKHFGLSTILHCLKDLCKKKLKTWLIGQRTQRATYCAISPFHGCGFLAATDYALRDQRP